ncbi:MAG: hypothetical protein H6707_08055 [Deltaproteobacteria bacterium]|nr:hypothetical protein [Deltaproteobacteria bacterium]
MHITRTVLMLISALAITGCKKSTPGTSNPVCGPDKYLCKKTATCQAIEKTCKDPQPTCPRGQVIDYGNNPQFMDEQNCVAIAQNCSCTVPPPLEHGVLGRHAALVAVGDALYASAYESRFGDLVVVSAKLNDLTTVSKTIVDGKPSTGEVTGDPRGYRDGISSPGDDVGRYTDIGASTSLIGVAYHDGTNRALKWASRPLGQDSWTHHAVALPAGDREIVGRYSSLLFEDGKPRIAFTVLGVAGTSGNVRSELRWAAAKVAAPAAASDWEISTIVGSNMSCHGLCPSGEACFTQIDALGRCEPTSGQCSGCAANQACKGGVCRSIATAKQGSIPQAAGLWPTAVVGSTGPVVIYHDAARGLLHAAQLNNGSWSIVTITGTSSDRAGRFASAIASPSGEIHVVHQRGDALHYLRLDSSTLKPAISEVVDDGTRKGAIHVVGADGAIALDANGFPHLIYQDQQTADLLYASRASGSWQPSQTTDANLGRLIKGGNLGFGFFSDLVSHGGAIYGVTLAFAPGQTPAGNLAFFKLP